MDESIQKQIEAALPKLEEHWTWVYTSWPGTAGQRCRLCEGRYPQSRSNCIDAHSALGVIASNGYLIQAQ